MDKIESVYQRSEVGGHVLYPINFSCKQCGESYNDFKLKLAVFLYGIAFLTGKDGSFTVFTCPRCLKSNLLSVSDIQQLFSDLSIFEGQNGSSWPTNLTYYSSVTFSPAQNQALKGFDIPYWNIPLSEASKDNFTGTLENLEEENSWLFENGYLSSYVFDHGTPMGLMASIWFFNPKEIDKLIQIENDSEIKVFPRYYHQMSFYSEFDEFVWKTSVYQEYHEEQKRLAVENFDTLSSVARENNINFDNLIENTPNMLSAELIDEFYQHSASHDSADCLNVASDFLHLLLSDPDPWDTPSNHTRFYKNLWKFDLPFEESSLPESPKSIEANEFEISPLMKKHFNRVDTIKKNQNKKSIINYLSQKYLAFCEDIIEISGRNDYAYGSIWQLKTVYVKELYNFFNTQERDEAKYVFCKEGQTYTIIFDGIKLRGFRGGGFKYLYYLVANRGKAFSHEELDALNGIDTEFLDSLDSSSNPDSGNSELAKSKRGKPTQDSNDRISPSAAAKLYNEYRKLKENIAAAEKSEDPGRIADAKKDFSKFETHYQFYFGRGGRIKKFKSSSKTVKDKIALSLKRALNSIQKENNEVYRHFYESLSSPYSNLLQYGPLEDIDWHCE